MDAELYASLSEREKDVLRLLAAGHEAKSVAQTLGLSVHTVNEYLRSARRKLDAPNSRAAARQLAAFEEASAPKNRTPEFLGDENSGDVGQGDEAQTPGPKRHRTLRIALLSGGLVAMFVIFASVFAIALGWIGVGTPTQVVVEAEARVIPAEARTVASEWIVLLDAQDWAASHEAMGEAVKAGVSVDQWRDTVSPVRQALGEFKGRTLADGERTSILPGAPEGDYALQQFKASFSNAPEAVETVILSQEAGRWKVVGYYVR